MPTDPFKQVKAYFSPGRDALEVTIGFIQNTKKTLDVAIFSLTHAKIVGALLSAHARGVKGGDGGAIRILTDKDQMGGMAQREAAQSLSVAGLDVRVDTESGLPQGRQPEVNAFTGIFWYADFPNHYAGLATEATAELGKLLLEAEVRGLAEVFRAIKADAATVALQNEFYERSETG